MQVPVSKLPNSHSKEQSNLAASGCIFNWMLVAEERRGRCRITRTVLRLLVVSTGYFAMTTKLFRNRANIQPNGVTP